MIFLCLGLFLLCGWFLPWWALALAAGLVGFSTSGRARRTAEVAVAASIAWLALAYVQDMNNFGLISTRLAGVFGVKSRLAIYAAMAIFSSVTALLSYHAGRSMRRN